MGAKGRVQVFARTRPLSEREHGDFSAVKMNTDSSKVILSTHYDSAVDDMLKHCSDSKKNKSLDTSVDYSNIDSEKEFQLDGVFPEDSTQKEVFSTVGLPVLVDVMKGFNGCIFAYGQTGSGKTHSLLNTETSDTELVGLLPRLVATLYVRAAMDRENIYEMKAAAFQVYNEQVDDLLQAECQTRQGTNLSVSKGSVNGLKWVSCKAASDMLEVFQEGRKGIHYAETKMNKSSSRSHAIFQIKITKRRRGQKNTESDGKTCSVKATCGKLTVVDLAGSERVKKSGVTGAGFKEATNINGSLLALGNVISALASRRKHVPFRDSKLTRILEGSVGGNCKTSLLVCVSPAQRNCNETISTLEFASRAMRVEVTAKVNETVLELDPSQLAADLLEKDDIFVMNEETMKTYRESEIALQKAKEKSELQAKRMNELEENMTKARELTLQHEKKMLELEKTLKRAKEDSNTQEKKASDLETKMKAMLEDFNNSKAAAEKAQKEKYCIQERLTSMKETLLQKENEYNLQEKKLERVTESLKDQIQIVENKHSSTLDEFKLVQESLKQEKERTKSLSRKLEELRDEFVLSKDTAESQSKVLKKEKEEVEKVIRKELNEAQKTITELKTLNDDMSKNLKTEAEEKQQLQEKLKETETVVKELRRTVEKVPELECKLSQQIKINMTTETRNQILDEDLKRLEVKYKEQLSENRQLEMKIHSTCLDLEKNKAALDRITDDHEKTKDRLMKASVEVDRLETKNKIKTQEIEETRNKMELANSRHKNSIELMKKELKVEIERLTALHNAEKQRNARHASEALNALEVRAEQDLEKMQAKLFEAEMALESSLDKNLAKIHRMRQEMELQREESMQNENDLRQVFAEKQNDLHFRNKRSTIGFQAAALGFEKQMHKEKQRYKELLKRFNSRESREEDLHYISKQKNYIRKHQQRIQHLKRATMQKDLELENIKNTVRIFGDLEAEEKYLKKKAGKDSFYNSQNDVGTKTPKYKGIPFFSDVVNRNGNSKVRPATATSCQNYAKNRSRYQSAASPPRVSQQHRPLPNPRR